MTDPSYDAFYEMVNADVRDALDDEAASFIRMQDNVDRWYECLLQMKRSVEAQMTAKQAELKERRVAFMTPEGFDSVAWARCQAEAEKWRQGAIRFRNGVEDKIAEAKTLRRAAHSERPMSVLYREQQRLIREVMQLRIAIENHRQKVNDDPDNSEDADLTLWAVIE